MAETHKRQHTVPRSYLASWIEPQIPDGQVGAIFRISKDRVVTKRRSPEKSFTETDRYTVRLSDGSRDLVVEHSLAEIENDFQSVLKTIIMGQSLEEIERAKLCVFTAAMMGRAKPQGDHMRRQWLDMQNMIRDLEEAHNAPPTLSADFDHFLENSHAHLVQSTIRAAAPRLFNMGLTIFTTDDPLGFITSDRPATMYNPLAHTFPPMYRSPGLEQNGIEVILPLTPRHVAHFQYVVPRQLYFELPQKYVDEINRITYFHCGDEFVSWTGQTKDAWFIENVLPADAWEYSEPDPHGNPFDDTDSPEFSRKIDEMMDWHDRMMNRIYRPEALPERTRKPS